MPTFTATVEVKGECFIGDVAKTKKQAEMNAAKVALSQLQRSKLFFAFQLPHHMFSQKRILSRKHGSSLSKFCYCYMHFVSLI